MAGMKIKYDKNTNKILLILTVISGLFAVAGIVCSFIKLERSGLFVLAGICLGGGLFLFSGLHLLSGLCYVHRLKRHGYEIPYNKRDYHNDLRNVPCNGGQSSIPNNREHGNKESRVLFLIYMSIWFIANGWNIYYIVYWYRYVDTVATFLLCAQVILDLYWLISAIVFLRQTSMEKYRDDVETDDARKERTSVEKGVMQGIVMLIVMCIIKTVLINMSDYICHSRAEHDQLFLEMLQEEINLAIQEETILADSDSYRQMTMGCYISDWGKPEDEFSRTIAERLGISDFSELEDHIYHSDGKPEIYVKISEGKVLIQMDNPIRMDHGIWYPYQAE